MFRLRYFSEPKTNFIAALDRGEINDFFHRMGMPLSGPALNHIMNQYDLDSNDAISWNEFKAMVPKPKVPTREERLSWTSIGMSVRNAIGRTGLSQKLDAAFQLDDVKKIENLGVCHSRRTEIFADSEWAPLTFAVQLKGGGTPLLVTCAKPGHVEAWMEVFHSCVTREGIPPDNAQREELPSASSLGTIWMARTLQKKRTRDRTSLQDWYRCQGSKGKTKTIDWA